MTYEVQHKYVKTKLTLMTSGHA